MKQIPLANGKGFALVDDEDYERLSAFRWRRQSPRGRQHYAVRDVSRLDGGGIRSMHIEIMGQSAGMDVDHVDMNGLNNQKANLRRATRSQNMANSKVRTRNKTGLKGVALSSRGGPNPFGAFIQVNRKSIYLGMFPTAEAAHAAYREGARKYFGEFARAE